MLSGDNTRILERAACEVNNEMVINLGIGLPQLIPNFISALFLYHWLFQARLALQAHFHLRSLSLLYLLIFY